MDVRQDVRPALGHAFVADRAVEVPQEFDFLSHAPVEALAPVAELLQQRAERGELLIGAGIRSEEHTSELQSLMRISYAVFCLKKKKKTTHHYSTYTNCMKDNQT